MYRLDVNIRCVCGGVNTDIHIYFSLIFFGGVMKFDSEIAVKHLSNNSVSKNNFASQVWFIPKSCHCEL